MITRYLKVCNDNLTGRVMEVMIYENIYAANSLRKVDLSKA